MRLAAVRWVFLCSSICLSALSSSVNNVLAQNAVALVPRSAVAVAKLNWTIVRQDDRFRTMLNADQLDRGLAQLKINGSEVSEIVIFSGINASPTGLLAGIFRGSYSAQAVTTQLNSQNLTETIYKARTIYFNPTDKSCATILRSGMLVIGSQRGVEGVIDVETNPRSSLTRRPPFNSLLAKFAASRHPISFMMGLPREYQSVADVAMKVVSTMFSLSGLGPLGFVLDKIGFPRTLGFSIARSGTTFPVLLLAQMKDSTSAALVSGTLNVIQGFNLSMLSDRMSSSDREMLKNIAVTRNGSLLSIKMILREQDLPPPRR